MSGGVTSIIAISILGLDETLQKLDASGLAMLPKSSLGTIYGGGGGGDCCNQDSAAHAFPRHRSRFAFRVSSGIGLQKWKRNWAVPHCIQEAYVPPLDH